MGLQRSSSTLLTSRARVAFTVLFHSSCAIWSTLLSKAALNGIEAPVTLLALQTAVQFVLLTITGCLTGWVKLSRPLSAWLDVLPLTIARLVGILAKTFCLASVHASVYQISRGLLLPFTLLLSILLLRPRPHYPPLSLAGCALVMAGFGTGMKADYMQMLTGARGIILGAGSSFTTAVESVVVKRFLGKSNEGMWQLIWMSNAMALLCYILLLPLSGETWYIRQLMSEPPDLLSSGGFGHQALRQFFGAAALTGLSSFLLTIATFLQIEVTSPTTHMVVTAARGVVQSVLAIVILEEALTPDRASSMGLIVTGSTLYAWARDRYAQERENFAKSSYLPVANEEPAPIEVSKSVY